MGLIALGFIMQGMRSIILDTQPGLLLFLESAPTCPDVYVNRVSCSLLSNSHISKTRKTETLLVGLVSKLF